jgi:DNA polymerase
MKRKDDRLKAICRKILKDKTLPLKKTAANLVFGKGNPDADILFIGEAPGRQEDLKGVPFVGAAGKQLDALLQTIALDLEKVYIANILKYRPPNNRNPSVEEIRAHTPYLIEQIEAIRPAVIATLGNFATRFILSGLDVEKMNTVPGITQLHGKSKEVRFNDHVFTVVPLYHPAAMLYNPPLRKTMEKDFRMMQNILRKK